MLKYYEKYKEIINYLIFGVLTTLINYAAYILCTRIFSLKVIIATIVSWFIAVMFAYVTNRKYVFTSSIKQKNEILKESMSFIMFRLLSGIIDVIIMYITVNIFDFNDVIMKLVSNIIVIVINYLFSKIFVFKK